jgi:hypothetical protein
MRTLHRLQTCTARIILREQGAAHGETCSSRSLASHDCHRGRLHGLHKRRQLNRNCPADAVIHGSLVDPVIRMGPVDPVIRSG